MHGMREDGLLQMLQTGYAVPNLCGLPGQLKFGRPQGATCTVVQVAKQVRIERGGRA
jgi:hypothetical protein